MKEADLDELIERLNLGPLCRTCRKNVEDNWKALDYKTAFVGFNQHSQQYEFDGVRVTELEYKILTYLAKQTEPVTPLQVAVNVYPDGTILDDASEAIAQTVYRMRRRRKFPNVELTTRGRKYILRWNNPPQLTRDALIYQNHRYTNRPIVPQTWS